MLGPRWQKVWRDIWQNRTRTVLVILSIAVGIFAVGLVVSAQVVLARDLTASYRTITPASATLLTDPFEDDLVQVIRHLPAVRAAEGRRRLIARLQVGPNEWRPLLLLALPDYETIGINQLHPQGGSWPPPERQLLLERSSLSLLPARVDQLLVVELPDGTQRDLQLAGLVHDLSQFPSFFTDAALGYVSFDTLEWLGEPRSYNELAVVATGSGHSKAQIEALAVEVREKLEKSGRTVYQTTVPEPEVYPLDDMIQGLLVILGTLGVLALFLSVFLVFNTVTALLTQQIRQIGVMKTFGAGAGQIAGMYLGMVLIFGLLALLVAVPLGAFGARGLTHYLAGMLNFDLLTSGLPLPVLMIELGLGFAIPILAALWPVLTGTRISVQAALNTYGLGGGGFGGSRLDRLVGRIQGLSRPVLLSLRNTVRRKSRLALTLATLTLGGAIFIAVLSVRNSVALTIDETMSTWNYDVEVRLNTAYRMGRVEHEAQHLPGVVSVEGWLLKNGLRVRDDGSEGGNLAVTGLPATTTRYRPLLREGRWLRPGDGNVAVIDTSVLKDEPDLQVGRELVLKIEGRETRWQIVGLITGQMMGPMIYVEYQTLAWAVRDVGQANRLVVLSTQHDAAFQAATVQRLEQRFKQAGLHISTTQTMADLRDLTATHYNVIIVLLLIMALALGIVGGLGLMGTMSLNVIERTREIGVLRAIGASDNAVRQIVVGEGVLIGVVSWFLGVLLALPLSWGLSDAVGIATLQVPLSYRFSTSGALLWLGLVQDGGNKAWE
jgi:putative ABC transport system permease protein